MWTRPAAAERPSLRLLALLLPCLWGGPLAPAQAQDTAQSAAAQVDELIVTLRANGVQHGEFSALRTPEGDFWLRPADLQVLNIAPREEARRAWQGETWYSLRALGAATLAFDAAQLALEVEFAPQSLQPSRIDLSHRPEPLPVTRPANSAILNYRAAVRQAAVHAPVQMQLAGELNVRLGEALLRQEAKYETHRAPQPAFARGSSQLIWDDREAGRRVLAGDQLVSGGSLVSAFPGGGLSLARVFAITPDLQRQPTPTLHVSAQTPSEIEVSVDGAPVYRTRVGPGPVSLENLNYYGGSRNVRVTLTDAAGRRQVVDQPYFFTDSVLAAGLQEYAYFVGRRAELGADDSWHYREAAWQAFHRYGASDRITVEAGAEGSKAFTSGGAGLTLRMDRLGLLSAGALASADRETHRRAAGWTARYAYVAPQWSAFAARREYAPGFRSFATTTQGPALRDETRFGASARVFERSSLSADLTRTRNTNGATATHALRFVTSIARRASVQLEYLSSRSPSDGRTWSFNAYLRLDLEDLRWTAATVHTGPNLHGLDLETGRQLGPAEGVGYRVGTSSTRVDGVDSTLALAEVDWNLKPVTLELNASAGVQGSQARYLEGAVSGAVVALDGYMGLTRQVGDGFALARLGVPQAGVNIFLNNQLQGQTDARGELLIPQVGAFGRQDVSLNDKQLPMEFSLANRRVAIAPAYKSGTVVTFGGRRLHAVTGQAWLLRGGKREPVVSRAWDLRGPAGVLHIETARAGDFYLEDAPPGEYSGKLELEGRSHACRLRVPAFDDTVLELKEGVLCE